MNSLETTINFWQLVDTLYGCNIRGWIALGSLVLFVLFSLVLFNVMSLMHRAKTDPNVIKLQHSFSSRKFKEILLQWGNTFDKGIEMFKVTVILLDYIFPLIYASLLAFGYAFVRGIPQPDELDRYIFIIPFVAALLDWTENSLHLYVLRNVHCRADIVAADFSQTMVYVASICALIKFVFALAVLLAIFVAFFVRILG